MLQFSTSGVIFGNQIPNSENGKTYETSIWDKDFIILETLEIYTKYL